MCRDEEVATEQQAPLIAQFVLENLLDAYERERPANGDRAGYVQALRALNVLVLNVLVVPLDNRTAKLLGWFSDLAVALEDLDFGTVHPVLQPKAVSHRRPLPTSVWETRAWVALGVDALIMLDVSPVDAARQALREVNTIQGATKMDVLSWHTRFTKRRIRNRVASNLFATWRRILRTDCKEIEEADEDPRPEIEYKVKAYFSAANGVLPPTGRVT